jgi:hypothetical protein
VGGQLQLSALKLKRLLDLGDGFEPFDPLALGEQRSGSERLLPKLLVFKTVVLVPRCSLLLSLRGLCRRDLPCGCEPQTPQMR